MLDRRAVLNRRALHLAYATVAYNALEAAVPIAAGAAAGSSALIGFGVDSLIEMGSAVVVIWQFRRTVPESQEARALRLIAVAFFALAAWIVLDAGSALLLGERPEPSPVGIAMAATSLVVMPLLVRAKRRVAAGLGSATVSADAVQSLLCTYLAGVLLVGLLLNALLGWWWADPIAALLIAAAALHEGVHAWRGERDDD